MPGLTIPKAGNLELLIFQCCGGLALGTTLVLLAKGGSIPSVAVL